MNTGEEFTMNQSMRRQLMGSNAAAFLAGYTLNIIPIPAQKSKAQMAIFISKFEFIPKMGPAANESR